MIHIYVPEGQRGVEGDAEPFPLGVSPAGPGFGIASTRRLGDALTLQRLLGTAELAGFADA